MTKEIDYPIIEDLEEILLEDEEPKEGGEIPEEVFNELFDLEVPA